MRQLGERATTRQLVCDLAHHAVLGGLVHADELGEELTAAIVDAAILRRNAN